MATKQINKQIEVLLHDKDIIKLIKETNNKSNISITSVLVGEVYTYCFACNDGKEISKREVLSYLEDRVKDFQLEENKNNEITRAQTLANAIEKRIGININDSEFSAENENQIKNYFLNNYVKNGYVMHSFPSACEKSIEKHGLSSTVRIWNSEEILSVAKIFQNHGVIVPVSGYSYYNGGKMYVENDARNVLWHSLSSPEWFRAFTSSNHTSSNLNLKESPFILRDYNTCKSNVLNMCINANLSSEEKDKAMQLFEKNWKLLKSPQLPVALIKKSDIGKDNINPYYMDKDVNSTIAGVLMDSAEEYKPHVGNVLNKPLDKTQMTIIKMPQATEFLEETKYSIETEKDLFNPESNFKSMIMGVRNGFNLEYNTYSQLLSKMKRIYQNDSEVMNKISQYEEYVKTIPNFPKIEQVSNDEITKTKNDNPEDFPQELEPIIEDKQINQNKEFEHNK